MTASTVAAPSRVERLAVVHEQLQTAVGGLLDSAGWRRWLDVAAKFHRYSLNNMLLIGVQRPDATQVAGYHTWKDLGRQVRAGEKGIAILAPLVGRAQTTAPESESAVEPADAAAAEPARVLRGFRVVHVFDISQTDGPPLPQVRPQLLDGEIPIALFAGLEEIVDAANYTLTYTDLGDANGQTSYATCTIELHPNLPGLQSAKTLAHEVAHLLLHQPQSLPDGFTRERAEVEAESVAYLVCAAHGIPTDDYSLPYVAGWSAGDRDLIRDTGARVVTCAQQILATTQPEDRQPLNDAVAPERDARRIRHSQAADQLTAHTTRDRVRSR